MVIRNFADVKVQIKTEDILKTQVDTSGNINNKKYE